MIIGRNVPRVPLVALFLKLFIAVLLPVLFACASLPELTLEPETQLPADEEPGLPADDSDLNAALPADELDEQTTNSVEPSLETSPSIPPLEKVPAAVSEVQETDSQQDPPVAPVPAPAEPEPVEEPTVERQPSLPAEPSSQDEQAEQTRSPVPSEETAESVDAQSVLPATTAEIITEGQSDPPEQMDPSEQEKSIQEVSEETVSEKPVSTSDIILEDKKQDSNTALIVLVVSLILAALIVTVAYLMRKHHDTYEETLIPARTYADQYSRQDEPGQTEDETPVPEKRAGPQPSESCPELLLQAVLHVYAKILGGKTVQSLGSIEEFAAAAFQVDLPTLQQMLNHRKNLKKHETSYADYLSHYIRGISRTDIDTICTLTILLLAVDGMLYSEEVKALQIIADLLKTDSTFVNHIIEEYSIAVIRPKFPGQARVGTAVPLPFASRETMPPEDLYHKFPEMEHIDSTILVGILQLLDELRDKGETS